MELTIKFKKLSDMAVLPSYAKDGDAGLDLTAISCEYDPDMDTYTYDTGLAVEIPEGYFGALFPRSSISKTRHILANSVGVLDSSYRGSIIMKFKNTEIKQKVYSTGDRIGQLVVLPIPKIIPVLVDELSTTERGTGAFGHTGA